MTTEHDEGFAAREQVRATWSAKGMMPSPTGEWTPFHAADPTPHHEARSTSDAAVVPDVDELAQLIRMVDGKHVLGAGALAVRICDWLADRTTRSAKLRSTDSSAEAAGMERAAKWVDDRADAYDRDHGQTDPDTGTRWWPGDGEDYMFELDEIATGIRAEAAKLTTAPHTAVGGLPPPYDTRKVEDAYALLWASVPTRDPKPHAARQLLREHLGTIKCAAAIRRLVDSDNGPDGDAIHSALLESATTAPHTADETRVDGEKS